MPFEKGVTPTGAVPFKPGETGNPAGRPKGIPNTRTRMLRWLELEMDEVNPATGKKERATILEKMDAAIIKKALKGDLSAYKEVIDRLEGQSQQNVSAKIEVVQVEVISGSPAVVSDEKEVDV